MRKTKGTKKNPRVPYCAKHHRRHKCGVGRAARSGMPPFLAHLPVAMDGVPADKALGFLRWLEKRGGRATLTEMADAAFMNGLRVRFAFDKPTTTPWMWPLTSPRKGRRRG